MRVINDFTERDLRTLTAPKSAHPTNSEVFLDADGDPLDPQYPDELEKIHEIQAMRRAISALKDGNIGDIKPPDIHHTGPLLYPPIETVLASPEARPAALEGLGRCLELGDCRKARSIIDAVRIDPSREITPSHIKRARAGALRAVEITRFTDACDILEIVGLTGELYQLRGILSAIQKGFTLFSKNQAPIGGQFQDNRRPVKACVSNLRRLLDAVRKTKMPAHVLEKRRVRGIVSTIISKRLRQVLNNRAQTADILEECKDAKQLFGADIFKHPAVRAAVIEVRNQAERLENSQLLNDLRTIFGEVHKSRTAKASSRAIGTATAQVPAGRLLKKSQVERASRRRGHK